MGHNFHNLKSMRCKRHNFYTFLPTEHHVDQGRMPFHSEHQ